MKFLLLAIALVLSVHANADESARQAKIAKVLEAQGVLQMFQQQIESSKSQASDIGENIYRQILIENGIKKGQENPKIEQVLTQYTERCSTLFTAEELTGIWSRFYGNDLSEKELDKILAYYKSPVGKKDVAASQAALSGFMQVLSAERQTRINASIRQFISDLKAATETAE